MEPISAQTNTLQVAAPVGLDLVHASQALAAHTPTLGIRNVFHVLEAIQQPRKLRQHKVLLVSEPQLPQQPQLL